MLHLKPGQTPYPFHSHGAQWEFYYVVSGKGTARDKDGTIAIESGDALLFLPDEPHQFMNNGTEDLFPAAAHLER